MENVYKDMHVFTASIVFLVMLIITFSTENLLLLLGIFIFCFIIFKSSNNLKLLKKGFLIFIPFTVINIVINFLLVQQGHIILLTIGSRKLSLEALIYAITLSSKLLLVINIFSVLGIMMDSDRAVSYFSSALPKSTLVLMIALKLFPNMKKRLATLKEIYSIRGVNFEDRSLIGRLRAYLPILSILLEDSLETSFDIGEAAYSRGFLSSSRSVYERQRIRNIDLTVIATMAILLIIFLIFSAFGIKNSSIYEVSLYESVFTDGIQYILMIFSVLYVELVYIWRKLKKDELYTN